MDGTTIDWTKVVTALVAIYAAILSTYTLLSSRKEKKRQIKVELSFGFRVFGPKLGPTSLLITASNPGYRTVTLTGVGIRLPDNRQAILPNPPSDVQFPYDLPEGKHCTAWFDAKELAATLRREGFAGKVKLVGFYRDALGTVYASNRLRFNMAKWADGE